VMDRYKEKKVLVVGMGKSGIAASCLLVNLGAKVFLTEHNLDPKTQERANKLKQEMPIQIECGQHDESFFQGAEFVVVSPGVPETTGPLQWAKKQNIPIISELELGAQVNKAPIIAITGSNGKSTTTALIYEMLNEDRKKVLIGGNWGIPLSELILDNPTVDALVIEVSSFQLEHIQTFSPTIAVLTNLTPNHLDRHLSFEQYAQIKCRIFKNQKKEHWAIFHQEEQFLFNQLGIKHKAQTLAFNLQSEPPKVGAYATQIDLRAQWNGEDFHVLSLTEIKLKGRHNLENILAAINASLAFGVGLSAIQAILKTFNGLEHRLEPIGKKKGVLFVNDSKATSVDAVKKALSSFSSIIWIAGGRNKGSDFSLLTREVRQKVKAALFIGESQAELEEAFGQDIPCQALPNLKEAVSTAYVQALEGDVILFSPGCASFDMFNSYEERGLAYKKIVADLMSS